MRDSHTALAVESVIRTLIADTGGAANAHEATAVLTIKLLERGVSADEIAHALPLLEGLNVDPDEVRDFARFHSDVVGESILSTDRFVGQDAAEAMGRLRASGASVSQVRRVPRPEPIWALGYPGAVGLLEGGGRSGRHTIRQIVILGAWHFDGKVRMRMTSGEACGPFLRDILTGRWGPPVEDVPVTDEAIKMLHDLIRSAPVRRGEREEVARILMARWVAPSFASVAAQLVNELTADTR